MTLNTSQKTFPFILQDGKTNLIPTRLSTIERNEIGNFSDIANASFRKEMIIGSKNLMQATTFSMKTPKLITTSLE
jgi:hypothetical protein